MHLVLYALMSQVDAIKINLAKLGITYAQQVSFACSTLINPYHAHKVTIM